MMLSLHFEAAGAAPVRPGVSPLRRYGHDGRLRLRT